MCQEVRFLEKELAERQNYLRSSFQTFVTWYTFFITSNLFALGWFVSGTGKKSIPGGNNLEIIIFVFLFFNALSFATCVKSRAYFARDADRSDAIVGLLGKKIPAADLRPRSPAPRRLYGSVVTLAELSLGAVFLAWCVFLKAQN